MSSSTLIYIDSLSTASSTFIFTQIHQDYIINLGVVVILLVTLRLLLQSIKP